MPALQAQKMRYGRMALYTPGDAANAKQFASMHAVQRHMVDRGLCRMAYDDNEDEYADFYDFEKLDRDAGGELAQLSVVRVQPGNMQQCCRDAAHSIHEGVSSQGAAFRCEQHDLTGLCALQVTGRWCRLTLTTQCLSAAATSWLCQEARLAPARCWAAGSLRATTASGTGQLTTGQASWPTPLQPSAQPSDYCACCT